MIWTGHLLAWLRWFRLGVQPAMLKRVLITFAAALLLFSATPQPSHGQSPDGEPIDVIISTDLSTGLQGGWRAGYSDIDDGLAVAMANFSRRFRIRGIVVTFGNNYMEPELQAAKKLTSLMAADIPVVPGAAVALNDPPLKWSTAPDATGELCIANAGVNFMDAELKKKPAAILALGPLTDVACLLSLHPEDAQHISNVVAIMGREPGQSFAIRGISGLTDFNMRRDSTAVEVLLKNTSVPITFIGFSATSKDLITTEDVQKHLNIRPATPLSQFLLASAEKWLQQWNDGYKFHEGGFHPWDQNAVYYLMNPRAYKCTPANYEIVSCGPPYDRCAGQSVATCVLCPSAASTVAQCRPQTLSPQWIDSQGEHAQLWLTPAEGGRANFCFDYADLASQAAFHRAALQVLPPSGY